MRRSNCANAGMAIAALAAVKRVRTVRRFIDAALCNRVMPVCREGRARVYRVNAAGCEAGRGCALLNAPGRELLRASPHCVCKGLPAVIDAAQPGPCGVAMLQTRTRPSSVSIDRSTKRDATWVLAP